MVHADNFNTWEGETARLQIWDQPGLQWETLSPKERRREGRRMEKKNQNCHIEIQLWVTDLQLMFSATGHIADTSLNLFFWDIPDMVPWLSSESRYPTLPGLVNHNRVKELSGQLGGWSLERSKEKSGKKTDLKQLQHPLHR